MGWVNCESIRIVLFYNTIYPHFTIHSFHINWQFDECCSKIKAELLAEISSRYLLNEQFDHRMIPQYHNEMEQLLQNKLEEESPYLKYHWSDVATGVVQSLSGTSITLLSWHWLMPISKHKSLCISSSFPWTEPLGHVDKTMNRLEANEARLFSNAHLPNWH